MSKEKEVWMNEEVRGYMKNYRSTLDDMIENIEKQIDWYSRPGNHVDGKMKELYKKREEYEKRRSNLTYRLENGGFSDSIKYEPVDNTLEDQWKSIEQEKKQMMDHLECMEEKCVEEGYHLNDVEMLADQMERAYLHTNQVFNSTEMVEHLAMLEQAKQVCIDAIRRAERENRKHLLEVANAVYKRVRNVQSMIEERYFNK